MLADSFLWRVSIPSIRQRAEHTRASRPDTQSAPPNCPAVSPGQACWQWCHSSLSLVLFRVLIGVKTGLLPEQ